jgi:hypothetical protein
MIMKAQEEKKKEINTVSEDTKAKIVEGEIADDTVKDAAGGVFRDPSLRSERRHRGLFI